MHTINRYHPQNNKIASIAHTIPCRTRTIAHHHAPRSHALTPSASTLPHGIAPQYHRSHRYHPFSPLHASPSVPDVAATTRATFYRARSSAISPRPLLNAREENRARYHRTRHKYQLQRIIYATTIDLNHDIESTATSAPSARDNICCTVPTVLHVVLGYARVSDSLLSRTRYHTTHGTILATLDGASSAFIVLARDYARHISRADIVDRAATRAPRMFHQ